MFRNIEKSKDPKLFFEAGNSWDIVLTLWKTELAQPNTNNNQTEVVYASLPKVLSSNFDTDDSNDGNKKYLLSWVTNDVINK